MALKNTRLTRTTRGLLLGAVAAGAIMIPAAPAMAQPFTAPSWGSSSVEVTPVAGSTGQAAANAAQSKIGSPYVWGATGPNSFDCSGLVQWSYKQAGKSVPRTSYDQVSGGTPVSKSNLQPGDVIGFYGSDHVGIYIGNGKVVHAPTEGENVKVSSIDAMPFSGASRY
ncbi:C40 family peptidase [Rhodococcus sp. TAF43]|uniref:C40 family peptidase n=1 Tax=unclassified Rhodococcus (in: high G+C Gram-positive bacteria) TaxID=192944 RepID=UPI001583ADC6|nr:C40 family peptidase [Rhodococcus sp. W8901]QKT12093.1 C40 family peptidase [Rhodococcus sp. W8901]